MSNPRVGRDINHGKTGKNLTDNEWPTKTRLNTDLTLEVRAPQGKPHTTHSIDVESPTVDVDVNPDHNSVETWHQLVGEYVQPMGKPTVREHDFHARMRMKKMGSIEVLAVAATPYVVHRSPKKIARNHGNEQIFCSLQLTGPHLIIQDGQEIIRQPGELAIFDPKHPCTLACPESVNFLAFVFPRNAVGSDLEALVQGAATVLPTNKGISTLVISFLRQLGEQLDNVPPTTAARLADHTLDLLATFFASLRGTEPGIDGAAQRSLMMTTKAYINTNLADPDLSSTTVAAAHHVSVRHLQKIFETHGLTVSGWIRTRRLERTRHDLANPALRGVPITVIANRWGFADSAHFSRVFKAAHGLSPRDYRHNQLGTAPLI